MSQGYVNRDLKKPENVFYLAFVRAKNGKLEEGATANKNNWGNFLCASSSRDKIKLIAEEYTGSKELRDDAVLLYEVYCPLSKFSLNIRGIPINPGEGMRINISSIEEEERQKLFQDLMQEGRKHGMAILSLKTKRTIRR